MPVGIPNYGNTCYLNAVIQCLKPLIRVNHAKCSKNSILLLFLNSNIKAIVTNLGKINKMFKLGRQQDAHEFLRYFIASLEQCSFAGNSISALFAGKLLSSIVCLTCKKNSTVYDPFMDISLNVQNSSSVLTALKHFSSSTLLSGSNQYRCSSCHSLRDAKKKIGISSAPPVLVLHLKRFKFQNGFSKLGHHVSFPTSLNLANSEYRLNSVLVHSGQSCNSGHYYAFVKYDSWYRLDDSSVSKVDEQTVLSQKAYILFYSRVNDKVKNLMVSNDTQNILLSKLPKKQAHIPLGACESKSNLNHELVKSKNETSVVKSFKNLPPHTARHDHNASPKHISLLEKEKSKQKSKNWIDNGKIEIGSATLPKVANRMHSAESIPRSPNDKVPSLNTFGSGKWKLSTVIDNIQDTKSEKFDPKALSLSRSPKYWDHLNKNDFQIVKKQKRKRPSKEEFFYDMPRRVQKKSNFVL